MNRLSIIVPIYQVEQYIRPCIESIYRQDLSEEDFEVILVNDGTRDNSLGVISDLIAHHHNISVVEQANQGLSAARNRGLKEAKGLYILFLDSDDLLADHTLCCLITDAVHEQPDLLIAGFCKMTDEEIAHLSSNRHQPSPNTQYTGSIVKSGAEAFIEDLNPQQCYVWRTLYRRAFLTDNSISFITGIYFEDVPFTTECYLKARKCIVTDYTFYIYRQRPGSIVSAINKRKVMDFHRVLASLWDMHQKMMLTTAEQKKLMDTIYATFAIEIWYICHTPSLLVESREIISDLKQRVPNLQFTNGMKQHFVSFCYRHAPQLYIRLKAL